MCSSTASRLLRVRCERVACAARCARVGVTRRSCAQRLRRRVRRAACCTRCGAHASGFRARGFATALRTLAGSRALLQRLTPALPYAALPQTLRCKHCQPDARALRVRQNAVACLAHAAHRAINPSLTHTAAPRATRLRRRRRAWRRRSTRRRRRTRVTAAPRADSMSGSSEHDDALARLNRARERGDYAGVVQVMNAHSALADVQHAGCVVMYSILHGMVLPEDTAVVGDAGAVEAVVAALRAHGNADAALELRALNALALLCFAEENARKASRAGAVALLLATMRARPALQQSQRQCLLVLGSLAVDDAVAVEALGAGAIPATVAAMRAYPTHAQLQQHALMVLCNIGGDHALGTAAVEAVLAAARTHVADAETLRTLCRAFQPHYASAKQLGRGSTRGRSCDARRGYAGAQHGHSGARKRVLSSQQHAGARIVRRQ